MYYLTCTLTPFHQLTVHFVSPSSYLPPLVHVDEASPQVVWVPVTYEGQVLQEHTHIWDRGQFCGTQFVPIVLIVTL